jgi:hypothetical protein
MPLWPAAEAWPTCQGPHLVSVETPLPPEAAVHLRRPSAAVFEALRTAFPGFHGTRTDESGTVVLTTAEVSEPAGVPMVPVAQLLAADIPDLAGPPGADLLQVLWCPTEHGGSPGPRIHLRWRTAGEVTDPIAAAPERGDAPSQEYYRPRPCLLHPEQIVEYPWWEELPSEVGAAVRAFDDSREFGQDSYFAVSQAPGWKVGGHANWENTDLIPMTCDNCDQPMSLLLTIGSVESFGTDGWLPIEDAHLAPGKAGWAGAHTPTGVVVGRNGSLRVFVCRGCDEWPVRVSIQ